MNAVLGEMLAILVRDPSGFLWIVSAVNLLTFGYGLRKRVWQSMRFRIFALTQLLVFPVVTALAFYYAIRPIA
ncbi:hypothetical protein LIG30_0461 [Burkholderia sp. lig30]|jgi:hypothetical protein|uniref:hypothetical protein n=1 Tax=Burkholderia sp. lig30 TaxID=1192124 RepID=UPI0004615000|nr:hypothetical protein [Burkholderia sp. lig30]KDB06187.1 hypothetical protein LIG30_0461 [Burkholderia sp. lig30]